MKKRDSYPKFIFIVCGPVVFRLWSSHDKTPLFYGLDTLRIYYLFSNVKQAVKLNGPVTTDNIIANLEINWMKIERMSLNEIERIGSGTGNDRK